MFGSNPQHTQKKNKLNTTNYKIINYHHLLYIPVIQSHVNILEMLIQVSKIIILFNKQHFTTYGKFSSVILIISIGMYVIDIAMTTFKLRGNQSIQNN